MNSRRFLRSGFTLVELLVVIAIIAVIAALSSPALGKMLQKQREAKSIGNMKAVSAMIMSHVAETGLYPSTTSPTYCNALYSYLAPGQPVPPPNESNEKLAGTVFVSPFMTMELLKKHNYDKRACNAFLYAALQVMHYLQMLRIGLFRN